MNSTKSRFPLPFAALLLLVSFANASAYYDPGAQRWLNRDPQQGATMWTEYAGDSDNLVGPFESAVGANLYEFVENNPSGDVDPLGLDIWIIQDDCGKWGHQWLVGDNNDANDEGFGRTYWDVSKWPGKGPLKPANCPTDISFNPKSGFDPKNLKDKCLKAIKHLKCGAAVDKKVRDRAEQDSKTNPGRYDAAGCNCRDYANGLYMYGVGAAIKDDTRR